MLCGIEVTMTLLGITALVGGIIPLSRSRVVTGMSAYIVGALLTATTPLVLGTGFVIGFLRGPQVEGPREALDGAFMIEVAVLFAIALAATMIAAITSRPRVEVDTASAITTQRPPQNPNSPPAT
jgi:hypothetical protein